MSSSDQEITRRLRASVIVPPTSRRDFLGMLGAGTALLAGGILSGGASAQTPELPEFGDIPAAWKGSGKVVVVNWGGVAGDMQRKAWFEPFERLCGIKVVETVGPDPAKIKAMVDTKTTSWDLCESGRSSMFELMKFGDYWERVDWSLVEPGVTEEFRSEFGCDVEPFAQVIAYRDDVFPQGPTGWADFWDVKKFPGGRSMPTATKGMIPELAGALIADGVDPKDIYPIDIDRAIASLARIKPHVIKWWEAGAQPMQMLLDKEAPIVTAWNGRMQAAKAEGKPLELLWNGGLLINNTWLIPKGAPNLSNAQKLLAFTTSAIAQARYSMLMPYGFTNVDSAKYIPAKRLAELPTAPGTIDKLVRYDTKWWSENRPEVIQKFNKMMLG